MITNTERFSTNGIIYNFIEMKCYLLHIKNIDCVLLEYCYYILLSWKSTLLKNNYCLCIWEQINMWITLMTESLWPAVHSKSRIE